MLFTVFSPERGENTTNQARHAPGGQKQQNNFEMADTFIRIPLSEILIKCLSLRSLRLCGETVSNAKNGLANGYSDNIGKRPIE